MLVALLERVGQLVKSDHVDATGLPVGNSVIQFLSAQTLQAYLALDDFVMWASLHEMRRAKDAIVAELASRLLDRKLYKAVDVSARLENHGGDASVARFRAQLTLLKKKLGPFDVLEDQATRDPYKRRGYDSPEALSKVLIRRVDGTGYEDLADRSKVVAALQPQSTFRVYARTNQVMEQIENILKGIAP